MNSLRFTIFYFCFIALSSLTTLGCGSSESSNLPNTTLNTQCPSDLSQIGIFDNMLISLCGCNQPTGLQVSPGSSLTCTVTAPAQVRFVFLGNTSPHQIIPTGSPQFSPPSPVFGLPSSPQTVQVHVINFDTSHRGQTFSFTDTFNALLLGQIVVQ